MFTSWILRAPGSLPGVGPHEPSLPSTYSFRKNFGFGEQDNERKDAAFQVIQTEHKLLGPMSFAEKAVTILFVALVLLWFTREPGFFEGWGNLAFANAKGER